MSQESWRREKKPSWQHFVAMKWQLSATSTQPIDIIQSRKISNQKVQNQHSRVSSDVSPRTHVPFPVYGSGDEDCDYSLATSPSMSFSDKEQQVFVKPTSFDGPPVQFKAFLSPRSSDIRLRHSVPQARSVSFAEGMSPRFGSYGSFGSVGSYGEGWDPEKLLQFTEEARPALTSHEVHPGSIIDLDELLQALLNDEWRHEDPISLSVVVESRLDKLLEDILDAKQSLFPPDSPTTRILTQAAELQSQWRERFGTGYTMIKAERMSKAQSDGDLQDVDSESNVNDPVWCIAKTKSPCVWAALALGEWWPNISCAIRDGVIDSSKEIVTVLGDGTIVLPMLTGEEEEDLEKNETMFTKEGTLKEVHFQLMTCKRPIKVLRGHLLKSKYAPPDGIRYDGEYLVVQYGHKLDRDRDTYTSRIRLSRGQGQKTMEEIIKLPNPCHQDDDWNQHRKMVMAPSRVILDSKEHIA